MFEIESERFACSEKHGFDFAFAHLKAGRDGFYGVGIPIPPDEYHAALAVQGQQTRIDRPDNKVRFEFPFDIPA